jgi:hypothetical protein
MVEQPRDRRRVVALREEMQRAVAAQQRAVVAHETFGWIPVAERETSDEIDDGEVSLLRGGVEERPVVRLLAHQQVVGMCVEQRAQTFRVTPAGELEQPLALDRG